MRFLSFVNSVRFAKLSLPKRASKVLGLLAALRWLRHDVSVSCTARVGRNLKEGFLPMALNQISFVESPASCLCGGQRRGGFGQCRLFFCAFIEALQRALTGSDRLCHKDE